MTGYLNRPDLTAQVLKDGWLQTGDVGSLDEDGFLTMLGRAIHALSAAGRRIFFSEIENCVEEHPGGKQLIRLRWWPFVPVRGPLLTLVFAGLTFGATRDHAWGVAAILGVGALSFAWRTLEQCTAAMATTREAVTQLRRGAAG